MYLKLSSGESWPFCLRLNVLIKGTNHKIRVLYAGKPIKYAKHMFVLFCCSYVFSLNRIRATHLPEILFDWLLQLRFGNPICMTALIHAKRSWAVNLLKRRRLMGIGIPIIDLRRSDDRLRFIIGIPIPIKRRLFVAGRLTPMQNKRQESRTFCITLLGILYFCLTGSGTY